MSSVLNQVFVLFIIMAIGYIARKYKIINKVLNKGLSDLLLYVTLPIMIISSFNRSFSVELLDYAIMILIIAFCIHFMSVIIGLFLFKGFSEGKTKILRYITIFSNCGYMGYPVLKSIYGDKGVFFGSIYNIPFTILMWTIGISIFRGKSKDNTFKKAFINPGIIATLIGLVIFTFSLSIPTTLKVALDSVGSMTTPLSMMIIGSALAETSIRDIFSDLSVYYITFIRLIILPAITFLILKLIGINGVPLAVSVILAGMPAAANTVVFSEKYDGESVFASKAIFVSTILSIITIPLIVLLVK